MKIGLKLSIAFSIIFFALIFILFFYPNDSVKKDEEKKKFDYESLEEIIFDVKVDKIKKGDLTKRIELSGIARAADEVEIIANQNGFVKKIYVYEGKRVKKGELLLELDEKEFLLSFKEAEARLNDAKIEYILYKKQYGEIESRESRNLIEQEINNLKQKYAEGLIDEKSYKKRLFELETKLFSTEEEVEKTLKYKSGLTNAELQYEKAKYELEKTKIAAPFDGYVSNINLSPGQKISYGTKICKILHIEQIKVEIGILESELKFVYLNSDAIVKSALDENLQIRGKLVWISPEVDLNTRTVKGIVVANNKENKFLPGMRVYAALSTKSLPNVLLAPKSSVVFRDNRPVIFIAENNEAIWRYVKIGEFNDEYYQILDGVKENELAITEGNYAIGHKARIRITNK